MRAEGLPEMKFIKPERSIIEKSESWLYKNPVAGLFYWSRPKSVFDYLKKRRWGIILEIGCEYGFFLPSLCQISEKVIGSDIEDTFNYCEKITLKQIKKNYTNLELKKADVRDLSKYIEEGSCDVIVAISVLEHINSHNKAIEEIYKCLKPGGIFVCVLPSENWLYNLSKRFLTSIAADFRKHYSPHKHYDYRKLEANLSRKFKEVRKSNCPFSLPLFFTRVYEKKL